MEASTFYRFTLFSLFQALLLQGCAQNTPYHTEKWARGNCVDASGDEHCRNSYYQEYPDYDLAFAEYSERGNAFNDQAINAVLARIHDISKTQGVVLVVFVHGWKHNADEGDCNLINFKQSLQLVQQILAERYRSAGLAKRRLIGLYVGWRGESLELDYLQDATFWERKAVAEQVGKGGVTRLLLELDRATRKPQNAMVTIGHSFGGAIVVSAVSEVLTERIVDPDAADGRSLRTVGDGVLVLNPAIEANQALHFVEAAVDHSSVDNRNTLFVSLSSDADQATHYAFPLGQTVGLLATWRQADLERSYYHDRVTGQALPILKEEHLDATTVGNFAPFLTDRLTASEVGGSLNFKLVPCDRDARGCRPRGLTTLGGHPGIRDLPQNFPLRFIKTDDTVMRGHNDIFNSRVRTFVIQLVDDVVRRKLTRSTATPALNQQPAFAQTLSQTFAKLQNMRKKMGQHDDPRCPLDDF